MMENLKSAMAAKHISTVAIAGVLGCTEKTVYNKLNGNTEFTLREALALKNEIFPEYDMTYLFKTEQPA